MAEQKKQQTASMFDASAQQQTPHAAPERISKEQNEPEKPEKKVQPQAPVPVAPVATPAIPQILVDAGIQSCFSAPRKAFIAAGGTDEEFSREVNFAISMMMKNDYLITCAKNYPDYLVEAIKAVGLTKLSLNPELKLAYLVPRKGKIYFSSSYMGKREILMRAGIVKWVEANLVYDGDVFEVTKGTTSEIIHKPDYFGANRTKDKIKGGYWVACLPNGNVVFDVMPLSRIHEIMARSEAVKSGNGSPWDTDFEMMARKSILNWGFGSLPKTGISEHILKVIETESKLDNDDFDEWKRQQEKDASGRPDKFDSDGAFTPYEEVKVK